MVAVDRLEEENQEEERLRVEGRKLDWHAVLVVEQYWPIPVGHCQEEEYDEDSYPCQEEVHASPGQAADPLAPQASWPGVEEGDVSVAEQECHQVLVDLAQTVAEAMRDSLEVVDQMMLKVPLSSSGEDRSLAEGQANRLSKMELQMEPSQYFLVDSIVSTVGSLIALQTEIYF